MNQHACTDFSFGFFDFIERLDQNGRKFLEIKIKFLVISHDFKKSLICLENTGKEWISIGIDLNFNVGNVGFHSQSVNFDVGDFAAS